MAYAVADDVKLDAFGGGLTPHALQAHAAGRPAALAEARRPSAFSHLSPAVCLQHHAPRRELPVTKLKNEFSRKQWKDCCGKGCKKCEIAQAYIAEYGTQGRPGEAERRPQRREEGRQDEGRARRRRRPRRRPRPDVTAGDARAEPARRERADRRRDRRLHRHRHQLGAPDGRPLGARPLLDRAHHAEGDGAARRRRVRRGAPAAARGHGARRDRVRALRRARGRARRRPASWPSPRPPRARRATPPSSCACCARRPGSRCTWSPARRRPGSSTSAS